TTSHPQFPDGSWGTRQFTNVLDIDFGPDGEGKVNFNNQFSVLDANGQPVALTSNGGPVTIEFRYIEEFGIAMGVATDASGYNVFTVMISYNSFLGKWAYSFSAGSPIDHPEGV